MEAAESRPCKALHPQKAGFYKGVRKLQRMDGAVLPGTQSARHAQHKQPVQVPSYAPVQPYRATK